MLVNPLVNHTEFPPVTEAANWIADRVFPDDLPLINVSQAVPGYATSDKVLEHIAQVVHEPDVSKYGHVLGQPELREAYASYLATDLVSDTNSISASNISITAGCNQAFHVAMTALVNPGDEVLLPTPWYFNHKMSLDMLGIKTVALPCSSQAQLVPDPEVAAKLITNKTRAIVLITPNNPTGQEYPPSTVNAFYELCKQRGIALVLDETYRDFREDTSTPAHHVFDDPQWPATAIHLYSFSKAYALAGYRVGAITAAVDFQTEVTKVLDCVSICAPQLSQQAALFALGHAQDWRQEKCKSMHQRAAAFSDALKSHNHGYQITAMGAYFAYLEHPFDLPARQLARFLSDEANLLALPGEMFGPDQEKHLRFAFANVSAEIMPEIAHRLAMYRPQDQGNS